MDAVAALAEALGGKLTRSAIPERGWTLYAATGTWDGWPVMVSTAVELAPDEATAVST